MQRYNPKEIEPKWQAKWEEDGIHRATEDPAKPKKYILEYFPYPSGAAMHVGHVRNYTIGDAITRYNRMQGFNVLHPMGWDGFGLPAENYAIKNKVSPRQAIDDNTGRFKKQLMQMGFGYDWSREIDSTDPKYYKWTQWFFLLLHKRGLAYQQESLQWWCPVDKTVLANEQVEAGLCWRCGNPVEKKALKQWFFKITDYADRLAADLDDVNWTDSIKNMQRNWIGRSKGAEIDFKIDGNDETLKVFTTRPDTLFGATFMVVAPEHPVVAKITSEDQKTVVQEYVKAARAKTDVQRQETDREKTGVFTGAYAVNPINDEKIPVWVADYVLYGYGTGAIMAVPAHDERDYDFAKKFELPITPVVEPLVFAKGEVDKPRLDEPFVEREPVVCIVKHWQEEKYLCLRWKSNGWLGFVIGGVEDGEARQQAGEREIIEETGYQHPKFIRELPGTVHAKFYQGLKKQNRFAHFKSLYFELQDGEQSQIAESEAAIHDLVWLTMEEIEQQVTYEDMRIIWSTYRGNDTIWTDEGIMVNSGTYDGLDSAIAREQIVADLEKKGTGKEVVNYKIRDWLISRQRYWGAPIPMIHCEKDGTVPVPEDMLPVVLPEIESYEPSGDGRSPLANVTDWVNTTCPKCGGPAQRETDTMDGFACSSWYFLRFADPHNAAEAFDAGKVKFWLPVDDYIGGAEHAVMHLLYARMWTKVMQDAGLIDFGEPFKTLRNQGMILAPDGNKMSKSKGNTIEPDFLIEQGYGADAIRVMELFIGPWNQSANWSVEGMGGAYRFLQRVWTLTQEYKEREPGKSTATDEVSQQLLRSAHKTVKKINEDFQNLSFNTAIAALMQYVNELYKIKADHGFAASEWRFAVESLLQLLAPFAPHITEELWQQIGKDGSVHVSGWPAHDEQYLVEETVIIVAQVNGKVRGQLQIAKDAVQEDVEAAARADGNVAAHLDGKNVVKTVFVPGKLVNFVVK